MKFYIKTIEEVRKESLIYNNAGGRYAPEMGKIALIYENIPIEFYPSQYENWFKIKNLREKHFDFYWHKDWLRKIKKQLEFDFGEAK